MTIHEFARYCLAQDEVPKKAIIEPSPGVYVGELTFNDGRVFHLYPGSHVEEVTSAATMSQVLVRHRLRQSMN
jgi:hypothetical protein